MDGVAAVRFVLVADTALVALVPTDRIVAGPLPLGMGVPAISLHRVSGSDLNLARPAAKRFVTEHVQVTVLAADYPSQKAILRAVRHAAADQLYPAVPGISGVTIHTEGAGPDFMNAAATLWQGSQDFAVKFSETR